jgi:hypothetical protein
VPHDLLRDFNPVSFSRIRHTPFRWRRARRFCRSSGQRIKDDFGLLIGAALSVAWPCWTLFFNRERVFYWPSALDGVSILRQRFAAFSPNSGIGLGWVVGGLGRAMTKLAIDVVLFCSGLPFVTVLVIAAANALR